MHRIHAFLLVLSLLGFSISFELRAEEETDPNTTSFEEDLLADPIAVAEAALDRADFLFIYINYQKHIARPGIQCFLHVKQPGAFEHLIYVGDIFQVEIGKEMYDGPGSMVWGDKIADAARLYNQHLARDSRYPDPDICWPDETKNIPYRPERDHFLKLLGDENGKGPAHQDLDRFRSWKGDPDNEAQRANLVEAARHGHIEAAEAFLKAGDSPNQADEWGLTALDWAIARNNEPLVSLLLNSGAKPFQNRYSEDWLKHELNASLRKFGQHETRWAILADNPAILRLILETLFKDQEKCIKSFVATKGMKLAVRANQSESLDVLTDWYDELDLRDCERHGSAMGWVFDTAEELGRTELAERLKERYGEN